LAGVIQDAFVSDNGVLFDARRVRRSQRGLLSNGYASLRHTMRAGSSILADVQMEEGSLTFHAEQKE
jgi:hypothetical protein